MIAPTYAEFGVHLANDVPDCLESTVIPADAILGLVVLTLFFLTAARFHFGHGCAGVTGHVLLSGDGTHEWSTDDLLVSNPTVAKDPIGR